MINARGKNDRLKQNKVFSVSFSHVIYMCVTFFSIIDGKTGKMSFKFCFLSRIKCMHHKRGVYNFPTRVEVW